MVENKLLSLSLKKKFIIKKFRLFIFKTFLLVIEEINFISLKIKIKLIFWIIKNKMDIINKIQKIYFMLINIL